jgi:hypothetical protein
LQIGPMSLPCLPICVRLMSEQSLPSSHQLHSVWLLARVLHAPETPRDDALRSFRAVPTSGTLGTQDFLAGESILASLGLIEVIDEVLLVADSVAELASASREDAATLLLTLALERRPPSWLRFAAAGDALKSNSIPDAELAALENSFVDPAHREAILLAAARRYDAARLAAFGALGEEYVAECCREQLRAAGGGTLAEAVSRVSLLSDQLGYDVVAPRLDGSSRRIEVKATRRLAWRGEVYISRNEYEIGLLDPDWSLVVVEIDAEETPSLLGWCRAGALEAKMPVDRHHFGRWNTVRLLQADGMLNGGLPSA